MRGAFREAAVPLKQEYRPRPHRKFQMKGEQDQAMIKILKEFIKRGWTELCLSEWASPCIFVPIKVAGDCRLALDYPDLNSEFQHDAYYLLLIDNLLQKQQGKRIFSVLDLKHGYARMPLAKSLQDATGMSDPLRLMRCKVMPMGLKNDNAQFQRMTEDLLRDLNCVDRFVDDIIFSSGTPEMTDDELIEVQFIDLCKVLHVPVPSRPHSLLFFTYLPLPFAPHLPRFCLPSRCWLMVLGDTRSTPCNNASNHNFKYKVKYAVHSSEF